MMSTFRFRATPRSTVATGRQDATSTDLWSPAVGVFFAPLAACLAAAWKHRLGDIFVDSVILSMAAMFHVHTGEVVFARGTMSAREATEWQVVFDAML